MCSTVWLSGYVWVSNCGAHIRKREVDEQLDKKKSSSILLFQYCETQKWTMDNVGNQIGDSSDVVEHLIQSGITTVILI